MNDEQGGIEIQKSFIVPTSVFIASDILDSVC